MFVGERNNWGTNICTKVRATTAWPADSTFDHIIEALVEKARYNFGGGVIHKEEEAPLALWKKR